MSTNSLVSLQALLEIGFSQGKAEQLWTEWSNWPEGPVSRETDPYDGGLQMTFDHFFIAGLERDDGDVWGDDETEWRNSLTRYGINSSAAYQSNKLGLGAALINSDTQDAIMNPEFEHLRLAQSARFLAKDTVEMRYAWLQRCANQSTTIPSLQSSTAENDGQAPENIPHEANRGPPYKLKLYKAAELGRAHRLFDENGAFDCIADLRSPAPSDFTAHSSAFYFSPDIEVAQLEGAYAKRRASRSSIVLIQITIPVDEIDKLPDEEILSGLHWTDLLWKQLVWSSRRGEIMSGDLRKYRGVTIIVGTKARLPNAAYSKMESPGDIKKDCIYMVTEKFESPSAIQWMFSAEGEEFLRDHGSFKVVSYF
ncbi:hypothetical protein GCG54_00007871 [Colletotrichum gloeosporioides]|uniref:Uncharacterized protein n=1 Tax=Colletotrichum gloeosporioides TaxID=474922 RepID=A0A8H4FJ25_COLGL|nr:uncharacterized protein GCG54_00007871 [Colletotrichum gloeosporioides]KAF3804077.1 hypothetical protein GCG54_00007871 [Colletotrichum gloeosporioides]